VIPYADFTFFGLLLLYAVLPTLILGLFGRANWQWALLLTALMLIVQYQTKLKLGAHWEVAEIWIVLGFAIWQWAVTLTYAATGSRGGFFFYGAVVLLHCAVGAG
jgi:hypothetical protein